ATPLAAFEDPYDKYRYNREEEFDYDESLRKPWQEGQSEIPPLPKASAMLEVPIDGLGDDFEVLIDPNSLSIGEDRVVRYWLMLRSHLGAVNLHYEGINCNTGQYKAYAYGSPREASGFRVVKEPRWAPLKALRGRGFRPELQQLFCDYGLPLARRDIIKRIRDAASGFGSGRDSGPNAFF
ncbi:MAG: CNP1-like family protein, partial [Gammaproteobacteria bacterium SHHR-1]